MKQIACVALFLLASLAHAQSTDGVEMTLTEGAYDQPAGTVALHATIVNRTNRIAKGIDLRLFVSRDSLPSVLIDAPGWECVEAYSAFACSHAPLEPQSEHAFNVTLRFLDRAGRAWVDLFLTCDFDGAFGNAYARTEVVLIKPFVVRNTSDDGEGSLRRAISDLNADRVCSLHPCGISFAIDGAGGWQTIAPLSPLPPIIAKDLFIDGTTQSDTNPLGPDIELLGTNVRSGHGLEVHAPAAVIRGLAIGGFPGNGIQYHPTARGSEFTFERNYVGVDPTGTRAVANGLRGITIEAGIVSDSAIRDNVLSGNVRSGLFIVTVEEPAFPLSPVIRVDGNRIGVAAASDAPIPNGASGIFCGPRSEQISITNNVIANHPDFGIAIGRGARFVDVGVNRIVNNGVAPIDIGLDGPSDSQGFGSVGARAVLESATYDVLTGMTTIVGRRPLSGIGHITFSVSLYANSSVNAAGYAETEQHLGELAPSLDARFVFVVNGDLRGKSINALARRVVNFDGSLLYDTSEMSKAIAVR